MKSFNLAVLLGRLSLYCKTEDSGPLLYRRDDKVEKRACLRGKIITRWMQRTERKSLTKPIRKDNLQASTLNRRFDFNFQELRNTVTSEADCVNGRNIAEHQLAFELISISLRLCSKAHSQARPVSGSRKSIRR
jgi:hypothetical protein